MSWPVVKITEVARVVGGATPKTEKSEFWGGEIAWATPKDLSDLGQKSISATSRYITAEGLKSCAAEVLPTGSVLFSSRAPIGHVAVNEVPMATNQGFKSFIPTERLDASFLYWWLDANRVRLQAMGTGATFKEVSKAVVEKIEIPLPPLEEQKRIAGILDQADALRRLRARALEKLNTLGQVVFQEMFWDVETHSELSGYVDPERSITYGILKPGDHIEDGVPYIRVVDMKPSGINAADVKRTSKSIALDYKRSALKAGDLLMSIRGHVGRTAIVPVELDGANITQDTARLAVPLNEALFFDYAIRSTNSVHWMRQRTKGAAVQGINLGDLRNLPIPLVDREARIQFSMKMALLQKNVQSVRVSSDSHSSLFASLQSAAFQGRL